MSSPRRGSDPPGPRAGPDGEGGVGEARSLERWGWGSISVNVLLAVVHAFVAVASSSLAVSAELVHNVADLLGSVAVLVGLKLAARRSKAFPYGLHKVENLVTAGLAGLVFATAYEIGKDALAARSAPPRSQAWMLAALAATTVLPLVFGHFELRAGRTAGSPSLVADAREYRVHVLTTGLAFAALASQALGMPLDRGAALVIVVVVAKTGWELLRDAMRVLLDASLDAETLLRIREVVHADPAVRELSWVTGRSAGRFRFVEAGVALRVSGPERTEAVVRRVEASVRSRVPHVERVLVHVEAPATPYFRGAVPLADRAGTVSPHFGKAPYFALVSLRRVDGSVTSQSVVETPHLAEDKARGLRVAEWLAAEKVDVVLTKEEMRGKGPEYVLRDAGIVLVRTDAATLDGALSSLAGEPGDPSPGAGGS
jgi:cation diffusion facilitator family transporter